MAAAELMGSVLAPARKAGIPAVRRLWAKSDTADKGAENSPDPAHMVSDVLGGGRAKLWHSLKARAVRGQLSTARWGRTRPARRLIINADDFGLSHEVNTAVIRAHTECPATASLMVNEEGFGEAVELARQHPRLGVGLHLSLVCGRSALRQVRFQTSSTRSNGFRIVPCRRE